jgi:hypothetical protein
VSGLQSSGALLQPAARRTQRSLGLAGERALRLRRAICPVQHQWLRAGALSVKPALLGEVHQYLTFAFEGKN